MAEFRIASATWVFMPGVGKWKTVRERERGGGKRLVTNEGEGGGATKQEEGGGAACEVLPLQKGGGEF